MRDFDFLSHNKFHWHTYTKLSKMINETSVSSPVSKTSLTYGGYGYRWRNRFEFLCLKRTVWTDAEGHTWIDISGIKSTAPDFIRRNWAAIAFWIARKPSWKYPGGSPPLSVLRFLGPRMSNLGNSKSVLQLLLDGINCPVRSSLG